jgi:phosphohistidine phosphatase
MERTLVVVRHAKSDWDAGAVDHERPLNERGRREAVVLGRWLRDHVETIDLVICSSATRARQTWRLAAPELDPAPPHVRYEQRVYAAEPQTLLSVLDEVADEVGTTALIGHNPGLSELVETVTGQAVELRTSAVAVVRWDGAWADVWARRAALVAQATPRG